MCVCVGGEEEGGVCVCVCGLGLCERKCVFMLSYILITPFTFCAAEHFPNFYIFDSSEPKERSTQENKHFSVVMKFN